MPTDRYYYEFGPFRLRPSERTLLHQGHPVAIAPKAFDTLVILVENAGRLISKEQLMRVVWPDTTVEQGNLKLAVHNARRALAIEGGHVPADYIETVAKGGYRFNASVKVLEDKADIKVSESLSKDVVIVATKKSDSSGRLGGHGCYILICCVLYAGLFSQSVVLELAYEFDKYGDSILKTTPVVFGLMFASLLAAFVIVVRWRGTGAGTPFAVHCSMVLVACAGLVLWVNRYLPSIPITQATFQTNTAQAAYLKDASYFAILGVFYLVIPFNFVIAAQREITKGRHLDTLRLVCGDWRGVSPRGIVYINIWLLFVLLVGIAGVGIYSMMHLLNHLQKGQYMNLFMQMTYLRCIFYFGLAGFCLVWYHRELNEIKRLCLSYEADWH